MGIATILSVFTILGINGTVFNWVHDLTGHVALADDAMKFSAQYLIFVLAAAVAGTWFLRYGPPERRRAAVYTAVGAAGIGLIVGLVIQHFYYHPRPFFFNDHGTIRYRFTPLVHHSADTSFPSDHATASFGMATGVLLYRARVGLAALAVAVIISFSRVYVGVHYPADVVAGAAIGALSAFALRLIHPVIAWLDDQIVVRLVPEFLR